MGRFSNSKQLAGASWGVLRADKELMTIPVIGALVSGVIAIGVGAVVYATLETTTDAAGETTTSVSALHRLR